MSKYLNGVYFNIDMFVVSLIIRNDMQHLWYDKYDIRVLFFAAEAKCITIRLFRLTNTTAYSLGIFWSPVVITHIDCYPSLVWS